MFLSLNLLLYGIMLARQPKKLHTSLDLYGHDNVMKAYPGWRDEDVNTLLTETWQKVKFEYEPFTGFREVSFHGVFVNIDPASFRLSKNQAPWPPRPEATNVFIFGGSHAFGFGLPDDEPSLPTCRNLLSRTSPPDIWRYTTLGALATSAAKS